MPTVNELGPLDGGLAACLAFRISR